MKIFIKIVCVALQAILCCTLLQSCADDMSEVIETQSIDDYRLVSLGKEYVYFDRDHLVLNITKKEAIKKGVSNDEYITLTNKLEEINKFMEETINSLPEGQTIKFTVPANRILNASDISRKITIRYLKPDDLLQIINKPSTRAVYQVSSWDGRPVTEEFKGAFGSYDVTLSATTKCAFGLVRAAANFGSKTIETNTGFTLWPANIQENGVRINDYVSISIAGTCECWASLLLKSENSNGK